jgi:hypothetical protein
MEEGRTKGACVEALIKGVVKKVTISSQKKYCRFTKVLDNSTQPCQLFEFDFIPQL